MKNINYIQILKDALKITWKNRYLWWFGFFIILSSCGGFFSTGDSKEEKDYQQVIDFVSAHFQFVATAFVIIFLIWLALLLVGVISRGALIKSLQKNIEGKMSNFKKGFQDGKKYFWKIILIGILCMIFAMAAMFVFIIPITFLFSSKYFILGGISVFVAIVFLVPVLFFVYFTQIFGSLYAVLADLSVWDSLEKGYRLILKNVWVSILMSLLLILINIIPAILFLIVLIFLAIPFLILGGLLFLIFNTAGAIIVACIAGIIFILLALFLGSIMKVFSQAVWVLFFNEIAKVEKEEIVIEKEEIKAAEITGVPA